MNNHPIKNTKGVSAEREGIPCSRLLSTQLEPWFSQKGGLIPTFPCILSINARITREFSLECEARLSIGWESESRKKDCLSTAKVIIILIPLDLMITLMSCANTASICWKKIGCRAVPKRPVSLGGKQRLHKTDSSECSLLAQQEIWCSS